MPAAEHRLERRSAMLAEKIRHRIRVLTDAMRPDGSNILFTNQITNQQALAFWRKHRYTDIGKRILAGWTPTQVVQLDNWLARNPDPATIPDELRFGP